MSGGQRRQNAPDSAESVRFDIRARGGLLAPLAGAFFWVGQRAARPFPERRPANPRRAASLIWSKVANARATGKLQSDHKGKGPEELKDAAGP